MSDWKTYFLEDVIENFIDYRGKTPTKKSFGVPLITAKIVKNGRILEPNEFISEKEYAKWMTRGFPQINDLVITTEAPLGEVALIKDKNFALAQRIITLQTKKKLCDSVFLKYYFQSNVGKGILQERASGTTVEGIKSAELKKIKITIPSLSQQTAIAEILSILDQKIDLLNRQNKTLEELAKTLFRQWFIEESEEDGKLGRLVNFVTFTKGKKPVKVSENYFIGSIPQILIETFDTGQTYYTEPNGVIIASEKDILMVMDGASSGRVEIGLNGAVGSTIGLFKPINDFDFPLFLFCFLKLNENYIKDNTTGSAIPHADKELILNLEFYYSDMKRITNFEKIATSIFDKIILNRNQIRILIQLRDTLLPKLMSGVVRVK